MRIGIPKEIKSDEHRVGVTPGAAADLVKHGHEVMVEQYAGEGAGFANRDYEEAGAGIAANAREIFDKAQLLIKVKEPLAEERAMLRPDHVLFTYLHLAADSGLTRELLDSGATCIAYETITDDDGKLPLLTPMSQIAGRLAVQAGATHLEKPNGGRGLLLGGATGVPPARVAVIGGGVVGGSACRIALGMGADVYVLDKSIRKLEQLSQRFGSALTTIYASVSNTREQVVNADLVIGAVLAPGRSAEKIITGEMVRQMKAASVIVDVAIDQGGCCEHARPTTHHEPTFVVDEVIHYCVANMPGAVPATASAALSNATLPYILELADKGPRRAMEENPHLKMGLNIQDGRITHAAVEESFAQGAK